MKKIIMLAVLLFSVVGICLAEEDDYERLTQFKIDTTGAGGLYQLDFDNAWEYRESIRHADSVNKFWMTEHEAILLNQTRIFDHIDSSNKAQTKELANSIREITKKGKSPIKINFHPGEIYGIVKDLLLCLLGIIVSVCLYVKSSKQFKELKDSINHPLEGFSDRIRLILEKNNIAGDKIVILQKEIKEVIEKARKLFDSSLVVRSSALIRNLLFLTIALGLTLYSCFSLSFTFSLDKKISRLEGKLDGNLEEMRNRNPDNLNFYYPDTINLKQLNVYSYNFIDTTTRYVKICTLVISVPETIRVPEIKYKTIHDTIIKPKTIVETTTVEIEVPEIIEVRDTVYIDTCKDESSIDPSPQREPGMNVVYCSGGSEKCLTVKEFIYPSERGGVYQNYLIFYPCDKRTLFNVQIEYKFRDPFISIANNSKLDFGHYPERFVSTQNGDYLIYKIKELRGNEVIRFNIASYSALVVQDRKISCTCGER